MATVQNTFASDNPETFVAFVPLGPIFKEVVSDSRTCEECFCELSCQALREEVDHRQVCLSRGGHVDTEEIEEGKTEQWWGV